MIKKFFPLLLLIHCYCAIGMELAQITENLKDKEPINQIIQNFGYLSLSENNKALIQYETYILLSDGTQEHSISFRRQVIEASKAKDQKFKHQLFSGMVILASLPENLQNKIISHILMNNTTPRDVEYIPLLRGFFIIESKNKRLDILCKEIHQQHTYLIDNISSIISPLIEQFGNNIEQGKQLSEKIDNDVLCTMLIRSPEFQQMNHFLESLQTVAKNMNTIALSDLDENNTLEQIGSLIKNFDILHDSFSNLLNGKGYLQRKQRTYDWYEKTTINHSAISFRQRIKSLSYLLKMLKSHIKAIKKYKNESIFRSLEDYYYANHLTEVTAQNSTQSKMQIIADIFCSKKNIPQLSHLTPHDIQALAHFIKPTSSKTFEYVVREKFTLNNLKKKWVLYPFILSSFMGKYFPDSDQGWRHYILWNYFTLSTAIFAQDEYSKKEFFNFICNPIMWIPELLNFLFNNRDGFALSALSIAVVPLFPMAVGKITSILHNSITSGNDDIYFDISLVSIYYVIAAALYQLYASNYTESIQRFTINDLKSLNHNDLTIIRKY